MFSIFETQLRYIRRNEIVSQKQFPDDLNVVDAIAVFKMEESTVLKNYRPVSVPPLILRVFEGLIRKNLYSFFGEYLSLYHCKSQFLNTGKKIMTQMPMLVEYQWTLTNLLIL